MQAVRAGDAVLLGKAIHNDLQAAALSLRPALRQVLEVGEDFGALGGLVSGSGPTCAFIARDEEHALDIAVALTASGVCRTVRRAPARWWARGSPADSGSHPRSGVRGGLSGCGTRTRRGRVGR